MNTQIDWLPKRRRPPRIGFHISRGGLLYLGGLTLVGLVSINADVNLLMVLLGVGFGALVVSAFFNWIALRRVSVERTAPDVVVAGQPFVIRYAITCRRRWGGSRGLHIADVLRSGAPLAPPETFIPYLAPGETLTVDVPAVCRRRGRVAFERIAVATRFPFGLFTKYMTLVRPQETVAFPVLGQLLTDLRVAVRTSDRSASDGKSFSTAGDEEYYGVREYRAGDNPRRIHWRRSARTGQLMVREMSRSRASQLWCVVNTRVGPHDADAARRLETVISCAATVICAALERGSRVGLICNGEPLVVLPPGGGLSHRPRILRELALRTPNHVDDLTPWIEGRSWPTRWRGPCLVFGAEDTDDLRGSAAALGRLVGPATVYVPDMPAFEAFFAPAGGVQRGRTSGPHRNAAREATRREPREVA